MVSLHLPSWQGISTCHLRSEASTAHCRKNPSDLNGSQWISESRFAWTPEPKWFFQCLGDSLFFHNQSKNNTWSPAYIRVVPEHIHINVASCWIDLYLSFLCLRGQIMAISCILGCLWPVVIENLRYSSTYIVSYLLLKTILYVLGLT